MLSLCESYSKVDGIFVWISSIHDVHVPLVLNSHEYGPLHDSKTPDSTILWLIKRGAYPWVVLSDRQLQRSVGYDIQDDLFDLSPIIQHLTHWRPLVRTTHTIVLLHNIWHCNLITPLIESATKWLTVSSQAISSTPVSNMISNPLLTRFCREKFSSLNFLLHTTRTSLT